LLAVKINDAHTLTATFIFWMKPEKPTNLNNEIISSFFGG